VQAIAGRGLAGDRYFANAGTYSNEPGTGRHLTLIEIESIEALKRDHGIDLPAALARRNIVTRGVALNHLVGREFRIGAAVLRGARLCDPCSYLEKLTHRGVLRGLIDRGGLRADILSGGELCVGDPVVPVDRQRWRDYQN
jgi:MOSC domain-containing protein YiiM